MGDDEGELGETTSQDPFDVSEMLRAVSVRTIGAQLEGKEGVGVEGDIDLDDGDDWARKVRSGLVYRFLVELR